MASKAPRRLFPPLEDGSRPRLLLVSPLPPPSGGVASWTERILKTSLTQRYDVTVLNVNPGAKTGVTGKKVALYAGNFARLAAMIARIRPHVVHINTGVTYPKFAVDSVQMALARASGARVIMHLRGKGMEVEGRSAHRQRLACAPLWAADQTWVLSRETARDLERLGLPDVVQVSNFIHFRAPPDRSQRDQRIKLLFVGWVMKQKGLMELLEAVAGLPGVELDIAGRYMDKAVPPGTSERSIQEALDHWKLRDRVRVLGEVPMARVWELYDQADVFVLPTWSEGFPNVLVEAMMTGLPTVATPVGAIPEVLVDGKTGILVPMRDPTALRAALAKLVESRDLRLEMGRAAHERAMADYEIESVVGRICDGYDRLLGVSTR